MLEKNSESEVHVEKIEQRPMGTMLTRETEIQVVGAQKPAVVYEALMLFVK